MAWVKRPKGASSQNPLVALALTHVTIASVTIFLHRHQAHRALDLHPVASHFFRFWLWLTTGMVTKEWAAVRRKHHAKCETPQDPHSPQVHGFSRVLWGGVFLYVREAANAQPLQRYGHGTPDDWIERRLYSKHRILGIVLMGVVDMVLFGAVSGGLILLTQIAWMAPTPRLAAPKANVDIDTVQAVIRYHYDVLSSYARSLKRTCTAEFGRLRSYV